MNKVIHGDSLKELAKLEANSVDLLCTDPPYGYSFMGKAWDKTLPNIGIFRECLRVLKPGAFAFVMSAPRSDVCARMMLLLEDAGFRIDFSPIYWTFASGFPKSLNIHRKLLVDIEVALTAQHAITNVVWLKDDASNVQQSITSHSPTPRAPSADETVWPLGTQTTSAGRTTGTGKAVKQKESATHALDTSTATEATPAPYVAKSATPTRDASSTKAKQIQTGKAESLQPIASHETSSGTGEKLSIKGTDDDAPSVGQQKTSTLITSNPSPNTRNFDTSSVTASPSAKTATKNYTVSLHGQDITVSRLPDGTFIPPSEISTLDGAYGGAQLKPAVEVVIVAMKPLSEKTFVDQALKNGKGITWLDDCRVAHNIEPKTTVRTGPKSDGTKMGAFAENGTLATPHEAGRFPANLLVEDNVLGDHSRFFALPFLIVPKASKREKNEGLEGFAKRVVRTNLNTKNGSGERLDGAPSSVAQNFHPTVKPLKLMSYLITLGSRHGDTVLDPFLGSGTTALAAKELGRKYIGIEREAEYVEIATARVSHQPQTLGV